MKLVSKGRRGDAQRTTRRDVLKSEGLEPKLIALRNGSNDEHELLPISKAQRLRHRIMNHNFEKSSFLEVPPNVSCYFIGQIFTIVRFSTLPHLENSVSYSVPIMNNTFDS